MPLHLAATARGPVARRSGRRHSRVWPCQKATPRPHAPTTRTAGSAWMQRSELTQTTDELRGEGFMPVKAPRAAKTIVSQQTVALQAAWQSVFAMPLNWSQASIHNVHGKPEAPTA